METAIIGRGWVGKSMKLLFTDAYVYDEPLKIGSRIPVNKAKVAFICVPTPNLPDGSLDTSIVEEVVSWCEAELLIIRSTVNPGTCDALATKYGKNIVFMPEYLGETVGHPLIDDKAAQFLIMGGSPENRRTAIEHFQKVYNANITIRQLSLLEAEVTKLSENRAIMYKVAQCQELYDACEAGGVDYYKIREAVYGDDPRFNLWFTFVYPNKRGASSKCIPKDVLAWAAWAQDSELTDALLKYNERLLNA